MQVVSKKFHTIIAAPQFNSVLFRPDENDLAAATSDASFANRAVHPFLTHTHEFRRYNRKWPSLAGESALWPPLLRVGNASFPAFAHPDCKFITLFQYVHRYRRWPDMLDQLRKPKTRAARRRK